MGRVRWSHTFSCQLSRTLIAWPPPSPPPRVWTWVNPVACGVTLRVLFEGEGCAMPLYLPLVSRIIATEECSNVKPPISQDVHVFHQHIQGLCTTVGRVYAAEYW
jgi:hypothetical protein